ncbi:MAG: flagellar M-ring protein FliF [Planctomycetes bacterium]|nr:flagellar M-ring protein FliF [Planctomycetota bacterium]
MKQLLSQFGGILTGGTPAQRVLAALSALIVLLGIGGSVYLATRPDYALLFGSLDPADAAAVVEEVRGAGVSAEARDGGRSVYVPRQQVSEMRMLVSAAGLPRGTGSGWELFDDASFGMSNFVQNVTFRRALQGALARDIASFDAVEKASVNITAGQRSPFLDDDSPPKASVIVHTRSGRKLSEENVRAIAHLVSGAVESLDPGDVRVMDAQGHLLTEGEKDPGAAAADNLLAYRLREEDVRRKRAQEMLDSKQIKADVRIALDAEFQQIRETSEKLDPKGPVLSETVESRSVSPAASRTGGPAGTEAKIAEGADAVAAASGGVEKDETVTTEYGQSRTVRSQETNTPKILRLGVSMILHPDHQSQLAEIEELVKAAVMFDEQRGDTFSSMVHAFAPPEEAAPVADEGGMSYLPMILERAVQVLGILGALFLVFKILRTAERRTPRPAPGRRASAEAEAALAPRGLQAEAPGLAAQAALPLHDAIKATVEHDPGAATRVLRTWLRGEDLN